MYTFCQYIVLILYYAVCSVQKRLFTPPEGRPTNLRLSSTIRTNDVVQMLLSKFKASTDTHTCT